MAAELIEHLNKLGRPPLGQQVDLQIEMISAICNDAPPVLFYQHESREQKRHRGQQRIGKRIEWRDLRYLSGIDNDPPAKARSCATTKEIVPTKPPIASAMVSLRERPDGPHPLRG